MHFTKDGFKVLDNGRKLAATGHRHHRSSNGVTLYTVTLWADQSTSCNCPGWAMRKACKHASAGGPFKDTTHGMPTTAPMVQGPFPSVGTRRIKA
jgi:hypothetical protein